MNNFSLVISERKAARFRAKATKSEATFKSREAFEAWSRQNPEAVIVGFDLAQGTERRLVADTRNQHDQLRRLVGVAELA
jgi:hypothetical protein